MEKSEGYCERCQNYRKTLADRGDGVILCRNCRDPKPYCHAKHPTLGTAWHCMKLTGHTGKHRDDHFAWN